MKVLLIEDEHLIRKSLTKLLEKKGAQVDAVSTGKEALGLISENKYNKIICDLMLQDVTGFDIIEDSKRVLEPELIAKTFVIITAYSSEQVLSKAATYGCPLIRKPFEDLEEALNIMLS